MEAERRSVSIQALAPLLLQKLEEGGCAELTVTGRSMRPLLLDRRSRVRLAALTEPKRGDVIFYRRSNGQYVLHRLLREEPDGSFTMCGDGQTVPERGLQREQLLAVMQSFARRERWRSVRAPFYGLWWRVHLADRPLRRFCAGGCGYLRRHLFRN